MQNVPYRSKFKTLTPYVNFLRFLLGKQQQEHNAPGEVRDDHGDEALIDNRLHLVLITRGDVRQEPNSFLELTIL